MNGTLGNFDWDDHRLKNNTKDLDTLPKKVNWGNPFFFGIKNPRGQTLSWFSTDNEDQYSNNMMNKKNRQLLQKNNWIDAQISYTFNSHGFRSEEFETGIDVLFNGDSNTVGVGLPLDLTWSKIVADHFNIPHNNLAVSGTDNTFIAQRSVYWLPIIKPKVYVIKATTVQRYNWWGFDKAVKTTAGENLKENRSAIETATIKNNYEWSYYVFRAVIERLCKNLDIKLIIVPPGKEKTGKDPSQDLARDLMHYGIKENRTMGKLIIDKIKKIT